MADEFDSEGNIISLKAAPAQALSQPTLPNKMADKIDEEGNIIVSPLGRFKKLSTIVPVVSQPTAVPARTPLPVPAQSPHPTPPLASLARKPAVNTTKLCDDRHVWKVQAPALPAVRDLTASAAPDKISLNQTGKPVLRQLATAAAIARAPKTGGVRPPLNFNLQNILAEERKEMKQMFAEKHRRLEEKLRDDLRCRCGDKQVVPADHVPTVPLTTCPATASTISESKDETQQNRSVIAPLVTSWVTLLSHLRSDTIEQMKKLQKANKDKDNQIEKLKNRVACLVNEDNLEHLERQQSQTSYSSSDCASVSSNSSYKESSCESNNRQTNPVTGRKHTSFVPSRRTRRCSQSSSASNYEQHRSVTSHQRTRREADDVEIRRKQQTDYISRIGGTVDTLAKQYSPARYTHVSPKSNYPVEGGPTVLDVFPALCLFAGDEEPTDEELSKYDADLARQLRPDPIYSPTLRKPNVNWAKLNPFQHKNLPKPNLFPVHGCSQDPDFYEQMVQYRDGGGNYRRTLKWNPLKISVEIEELTNQPFGRNFGFETNMGVVAIPTMPLHGYRCHPSTGEWVMDAIG